MLNADAAKNQKRNRSSYSGIQLVHPLVSAWEKVINWFQ